MDPTTDRHDTVASAREPRLLLGGVAAALLLAAVWLSLPAPAAGGAPDVMRVEGERVVLGGQLTVNELIVRDGGVVAVRPYDGPLGESTGRLEVHARRIVVDATAAITADAAGWRGVVEGKGEGPGGGEGGITSLAGTLRFSGRVALGLLHPTGSGAGGAYGGRGGDGLYHSARGEWAGGRPYGRPDGDDVQLGSAGGALPKSHHETASLAGGNGGGAIVLRADEIVIAGRVSADGADGPAAEFDAGGGGAGGGLLIDGGQLDITGELSAAGGRGGRAFDQGGAGGGGRIKVRYRTGRFAPSAVDVAPGLGPCPGDAPSPWGCPGSVDVVRRAPVYLPLLLASGCAKPDRRAVVLVLDASSSMGAPTRDGRPAIEAAREAASAFVSQLGPSDRVGVVAFAAQAEVLAPLTADRSVAAGALARLALGRGSRLDLGLESGRAVLAAARPAERPVLIALTDGVAAAEARPGVAAAAAAARAEGVTTYALGFGSEVDRALLEVVAGAPDRVSLAPDAEDLVVLYRALAARDACPGGS